MKALMLFIAAAMVFSAATANANDTDYLQGPRIGEPVKRICFGRSINSWRDVDGLGSAVLLQKGVNDWFFVELSGACRASDFRFANTIGIESRPAGGCLTWNDVIVVRSGGGFKKRCFIQSIYEWNEDALEDEDLMDLEESEEDT